MINTIKKNRTYQRIKRDYYAMLEQKFKAENDLVNRKRYLYLRLKLRKLDAELYELLVKLKVVK